MTTEQFSFSTGVCCCVLHQVTDSRCLSGSPFCPLVEPMWNCAMYSRIHQHSGDADMYSWICIHCKPIKIKASTKIVQLNDLAAI